jgi:hypothetical protein
MRKYRLPRLLIYCTSCSLPHYFGSPKKLEELLLDRIVVSAFCFSAVDNFGYGNHVLSALFTHTVFKSYTVCMKKRCSVLKLWLGIHGQHLLQERHSNVSLVTGSSGEDEEAIRARFALEERATVAETFILTTHGINSFFFPKHLMEMSAKSSNQVMVKQLNCQFRPGPNSKVACHNGRFCKLSRSQPKRLLLIG